jgi:uncharacterized membrane protein
MKNLLFALGLILLTSCGGSDTSLILPEETIGGTSPIGGTPNKTYSFEKDIVPIFKERCNMCHGPTQEFLPIWVDYDEAKQKSDKIQDRLFVKKDMPMNAPGSIVGFEQQLIESWVAQGAPKNFKLIESKSNLKAFTESADSLSSQEIEEISSFLKGL